MLAKSFRQRFLPVSGAVTLPIHRATVAATGRCDYRCNCCGDQLQRRSQDVFVTVSELNSTVVDGVVYLTWSSVDKNLSK